MSDIKKKVEAVLFSAGKQLSVDELAKLCRAKSTEVLESLEALKKEYDEKQSSLVVVTDGAFWKFSVREQFISVVRKVVAETELSKSILETLAVIAYRYPILQSDLIKVRTNKAYDHLNELEKTGFISRKRKGRTNLILLTDKFFGYFELAPDKLKEKFKDFDSVSRAIDEKEGEVRKIRHDQKKAAEEAKFQDEKIRKEIDELDKKEEDYEVPLEVYKKEKEPEIAVVDEKSEKIGGLEIIQEEGKEAKEKSAEAEPEEDEAVQEEIEKMLHPKEAPEEKKGENGK